VKLVLSAFSIMSYDFLYLVQSLVAGWRETLIPWTMITGPFYELWFMLPLDHPNLNAWIGGMQPFPGETVYVLAVLAKLPILTADILCAFLIGQIAAIHGGRHAGRLAATIWLVNPYVLLTGEMDGSIELIPVALMLGGILLLMKRRVSLGSIALGMATALKLLPVVLLPAVSLYYLRLKRIREFLGIILAMAVGVALYTYWISVSGFTFGFTLLNYTPFTTVASELILTPYASKIGLATVSAVGFCFVLGMYWTVRLENLFDVLLGFLLVYMAFVDWAPQYLLWIIPLMTVDLVQRRRWTRLYFPVMIVSAFLFNLIMFEYATSQSVFYVLASTPELKALSIFIRQIYREIVAVLVWSPILRSMFAGVAVFYCGEICVNNSPRLKALFSHT
jgi:hypothetical protein